MINKFIHPDKSTSEAIAYNVFLVCIVLQLCLFRILVKTALVSYMLFIIAFCLSDLTF